MVNAEAERALIGMIMRDASALEAANIHGITADSFTSEPTREAFKAIRAAEADMRPFDLLSLSAVLPNYLRDLIEMQESAPVAQNADYYAEEVAAAEWCRKAVARLMNAYDSASKRRPFESIEPLKHQLSMLANLAVETDRIATPAEIVTKSLSALETRVNATREGKQWGLSSGFTFLDRIIGGFLPGALYVLGARKKVGKTTMAMNMALNVASSGHGVAYFTVEMLDQEIMDQAIIRLSGVESDRYVHGRATNEDLAAIETAGARLASLPFYVRGVRDPSSERLLHDIRRLWRTKQVRFVVIDYSQQFRYHAQRFASRQQEMTLFTSQLKSIAVELGISILAVAQLNRAAEDVAEPTSSHIKDSGSFEQDADAVMLLWSDCEGAHTLNVEDNRRGAPGRFTLQSDLSRKLFREVGR